MAANLLNTTRLPTHAACIDQVVTGIEPVFNDRLNPGNNLLVRITVSRYWRYYVVGCPGLKGLHTNVWCCTIACSGGAGELL